MQYTITMTRTYTTYFVVDAPSESEALAIFEDMDDIKYNQELEQMNVSEEVTISQ